MLGFDIYGPVVELLFRFAINVTAMSVLIFALYYPRYGNKELAVAASMFNIFAFAVLKVLSSVEFSLAAGFGLFAILALFNLRSEQIEKIDISYFFGAVAIAVICSISGTGLVFVTMIVLFVLLGAWILDHPKILRSANKAKLTLDEIDGHVLSDPKRMRADLSERLGVKVLHFHIVEMNYVKGVARLNVFYRS